jgi:acyl-CoA synthetase (AMP-forming)/AMP-acid ligase II
MLTHRNLLAMVMNVYADICPGLGPADVILHAAPLSHGSGLYAMPTIGKAAANVIVESKTFDPELVLATIEQYRVTTMFAAPTMIKLLVDSPAVDRHDHRSLRACIWVAALGTFGAFLVCGLVPLVPFLLKLDAAATVAALATGGVFFTIGALRGAAGP